MISLFKYFLLLGTTGFGGPLSLIQLMREKYVDRESKITASDFDQAFTLIKAMPGPIAFQMAAFLGYRFHKTVGALLAGVGLILPSFLMMILIGYSYQYVSEIKYVNEVLNGFLYTVTAIILMSLKNMFLSFYKNALFWIIILITIYMAWFRHVPEPFLIIGFGLISVLIHSSSQKKLSFFSFGFFEFDLEKVTSIFKICFYAGAFVFGTGLAILPVLKFHFVEEYQWLTLKEFVDGVTFGQMTPGPVTITSTFLGFRMAGFWGSLAATVGVFLMPFIHMVTWFPHVLNWLSKQKWIQSFLIGATAAVVATILVTLATMNLQSIDKTMFWVLFFSTIAILFFKPKTSLLLLIFLGGLTNLIVFFATLNAV